jgi:uncharacterized protein (DUF433 family)
MASSVTVLERAVYGMHQVDLLLGLRAGTAGRWIDGYERGGKHYQPVIRAETTHLESVTWGEFVEARLLASYRSKGVPLTRMRPVVARLRRELETPYPLATSRLWAHEGELVETIQEEEGLPRALQLVLVVRTGQTRVSLPSRHPAERTFSPQVEEFRAHFDWDDEIAARFRPLGPRTEVIADPTRSFGAPSVGAIRTDILAEEFGAGDSLSSIARAYGLSTQQVDDALRFEMIRAS